jgi:2-methylcitrate dehydratase PrpD
MDRLGELLRFVVSTRYDDLPPDVRLASKRFLLDTAAVTLAGSDAPGVQAVVDQVRGWRRSAMRRISRACWWSSRKRWRVGPLP